MSIYNSPYRLRPINSAAARGIAPGDSLEIAAVQRVKVVKVYHTELRQSGDEDAPPKEKAKRNGLRRRYGKFKRGGKASNPCHSERRNYGDEYETPKGKAKRNSKRRNSGYETHEKSLASDTWRKRLEALSRRLRKERCEKRKGSKK